VLSWGIMRNLALIRTLSVFAAVVLLASCSDDDDGGGPGSGTSGSRFACTEQDGSLCMEYNGSPEPIPGMRDQCMQSNGTVSDSCSRAGVQGSCTIASGPSSFKTLYYGLDADGLNMVKQSCAIGGVGVWADGA
jgi:hypothetical protein